jgi:hypothetical protein
VGEEERIWVTDRKGGWKETTGKTKMWVDNTKMALVDKGWGGVAWIGTSGELL